MLDIWKETLKMHKNKNMEIFYGHKPQQLNKLFKLRLEESVVNPLFFVCCLEVGILFIFYVGNVCWVCKTFIKPSLSINRQSDSTKKKVARYQIGTSKNIHFPITVKKRWLLLRLPYLETLIVHPLSWDMFSSQHLFNLFRLVEKQQSLVMRILMFNSFKVVVVSY